MKNAKAKFIENPELLNIIGVLIIFIFCHFIPILIRVSLEKGSEVKKNVEFKVPPPISLELLRTYEGFENVSDEKGIEDVRAIEIIADILYSIYKQENKC